MKLKRLSLALLTISALNTNSFAEEKNELKITPTLVVGKNNGGAVSVEQNFYKKNSQGTEMIGIALKFGIVDSDKKGVLPYGQIGIYATKEAKNGWGMAFLDPAIIQHDSNLFITGASPILLLSRSFVDKNSRAILTPKVLHFHDLKQDLSGPGGGIQVYIDLKLSNLIKATMLATAGITSASSYSQGGAGKLAFLFSGRLGVEVNVSKNVAINGGAFVSSVARGGKVEQDNNNPAHAGGELGVTAKF